MLFFSRKHKLLSTPLFVGFKDYHNHTLPAVDDGVKSLEESLATLSYLEGLGFSEIVLTPHVMIGVNDTSAKVEKSFKKLTEAYSGGIRLTLAAEYMLDSNFMSHFANARMIEEDNILVETSYYAAPRNLNDMLFEISSSSISPVIAHPERYIYMTQAKYHSLHENEYKFQLNLLSFTSTYGGEVTRKAIHLLEQGFYSVMGTDLHGLNSFKSHINDVRLATKHIDMLLELKAKGL